MVGTVLSLLYDELVRIWCYRWTAIATGAVLLIAGAAYVLSLPNVYDSWAQIYINKQTSLAAAAQNVSLGENNGTAYVVQKTILNDKSLRKVERQINPAFSGLTPAAQQGAMISLRNRIVIDPDQGDGFTEFHYKDTNPVRAYNVVSLLLKEFVAGTEDRTQKDLGQADLFLDSQIAVYKKRFADSQQRLTEFRRRHGLLTQTADTQDLASAMADVDTARVALTTALTREGGASPRQAQIAALQDKIAAMKLQYTDQYPDLVAARQQLAQLEQAPQAQSGDSPAVIAARAQLTAAEARLRRLRVGNQVPPDIAAQESELERTNDVLRTSYQELLTRRVAAKMSLAVYDANSADKYQITNEPSVPTVPIGPNRPLYLMLVILAAIAGGLGAAYLRAAITGVFVAPRELEDAFQLPVIGTISWEKTWHTGAAAENPRHAAVFVAFGMMLLAAAALIAFSTSPKLQTLYRSYSASLLHEFVR